MNLEIQEALAAAPISTFGEALERAQRIENAKSQMKTFQARKRGIPSNSAPLSQKKFERISAGGAQLGKEQYRGSSREGQATTPRSTCNYCGKGNHTENDC